MWITCCSYLKFKLQLWTSDVIGSFDWSELKKKTNYDFLRLKVTAVMKFS